VAGQQVHNLVHVSAGFRRVSHTVLAVVVVDQGLAGAGSRREAMKAIGLCSRATTYFWIITLERAHTRSDLGGLDFGGITPVSNGDCKTLLGGVRFGRLEKRSQALLGSNLTRDIQADAAPMARPASGGKSSEAVALEPHWTPERIFEKILRRSRISPIDL
jgi:hypothetical protein